MGERGGSSPATGISPVQQMLASGTGALLTSVFVTPLDVVKIRLQAQQTPLSHGKCFLYCNGLMDHIYVCRNGSSCTSLYRTQTHFSGTLVRGDFGAKWLLLQIGVTAELNTSSSEFLFNKPEHQHGKMVMAVPATVIYFTCYDHLRDGLRYSLGLTGSHIPLIAGGLARLGAVTVISPLELVRTKMQSRKLTYGELTVCIRSAVAQSGWLSLWKGWGPTVLRDVPFSALYWFNYELVKARLHEQHIMSQSDFSISFTSGAISGAVAAVLTLPFDVVKTRRQIQLGEMETLGVPLKRTSSTWHILKDIWAESGHRGLFAGYFAYCVEILTKRWLYREELLPDSYTRKPRLLSRVIKVAPACAIMISSYEFGKAFFQEMNHHREQL
ncbi:Solute carrier family 25 member 39 [Merluccius polli]|uniref:Mitochondrial glutathione transporter SLC25A39 n=1 Tax=Merluccius polli TaxID=89951 RepID=A0AA47MYP9_MERPO|nr:Solute carrier family 25 member 39 [Merluccius polli]